MLKTSRAYFCQTVAEGSPLSRITSKLFGQARQSIEGLFRRPGRADEILSKQPGLKQFSGRASNGGLVAQIHLNSRGLLTRFAARNQTSELVNAMRHRYGWTGAFRSGMWGQKLSTFAFVGIGVAAGAQWNVYDERNLQDQLPDIMELFGKGRERNFQQKVKVDEPKVKVDEPSTLAVDFELDMPLRLDEQDSSEQSFIVLNNLTFDDDDVIMTEDQGEVAESYEVHFDAVEGYIITQPESCALTSDIRSEQEEQMLLEHLKTSLQRVDDQRLELSALRTSISQLTELLHDMVGASADADSGSFENIELSLPEREPVLEAAGDGVRDRLIRALSVAGEQQLQMSHLKQQLLHLNQQLCDVTAAAERPFVVRSSYSKRDACCGPGMVEI